MLSRSVFVGSTNYSEKDDEIPPLFVLEKCKLKNSGRTGGGQRTDRLGTEKNELGRKPNFVPQQSDTGKLKIRKCLAYHHTPLQSDCGKLTLVQYF